MKLLLLADLHGRWEWFDWASSQKVDALCLAGDVLDGFSSHGLLHQQVAFVRWAQRCPLPLAFCSGNHDANSDEDALGHDVLEGSTFTEADKEVVGKFFAAGRWMDVTARSGVIPDGRSEILETQAGQIVISTIPYDFTAEAYFHELWHQGAMLRRTHRLPWLVLHHDPPADTAVGGSLGDVGLFYRLREYEPDFLVSGHLHAQPYLDSFIDKVGRTWCFNPGAPEPPGKNKEPNRIELDLTGRTATWIASKNSQRGMLRQSASLT